MKKMFLYIIVFLLGLSLEGCKTSKHVVAVSTEDFRQLKKHAYEEYGAVILDEVINVNRIGVPGYPWNYTEIADYCVPNSAWKTSIRDKILLLKDSLNRESFSIINYGSPRDISWDVMKKCKMWLYNLDKRGKIHKRVIKKEEIIHERLNDSTCSIRLNIQENVTGNILVREYTLLSPYNNSMPYDGITLSVNNLRTFNTSAKTKPWIFQKDIPLLQGQFKIYLPDGKGDVIKVGNGEMEIKREKAKESIAFFSSRSTETLLGQGLYTRYSPMIEYDADLVTVTVSNVMPLPKDSNAEPLGIRMIYEIKKNQ